jgi:hypothetical protein
VVLRQYRIDTPRGRVGPAKQGQGQRATKSEKNEGIITYNTNAMSILAVGKYEEDE